MTVPKTFLINSVPFIFDHPSQYFEAVPTPEQTASGKSIGTATRLLDALLNSGHFGALGRGDIPLFIKTPTADSQGLFHLIDTSNLNNNNNNNNNNRISDKRLEAVLVANTIVGGTDVSDAHISVYEPLLHALALGKGERQEEHVVSLLACFITPGAVYMVMPAYLDFFNVAGLYATNDKAMLRKEVMQPLTRQLLLAVQHLHRLGIYHRDIKLENMLVTHEDLSTPGVRILLTDFGLSTTIENDGTCYQYVGTRTYACPEVYSGPLRDFYSARLHDAWSFGMTILYMYVQRPLWQDARAGDELFDLWMSRRKLSRNEATHAKYVSHVPERTFTTLRTSLLVNHQVRASISELTLEDIA
jgi:serine/threonine protein kinase